MAKTVRAKVDVLSNNEIAVRKKYDAIFERDSAAPTRWQITRSCFNDVAPALWNTLIESVVGKDILLDLDYSRANLRIQVRNDYKLLGQITALGKKGFTFTVDGATEPSVFTRKTLPAFQAALNKRIDAMLNPLRPADKTAAKHATTIELAPAPSH